MKPITVVNKATGEIYEFKAGTEMELAQSYEQIKEMIGALERAKTKIKTKVLETMEASYADDIDLGSYKWRKQIRHYMNYNLSVLRRVVDEDLFTDLVTPDKTKIDSIIKESVDATNPVIDAESAKELRASMYDVRTPSVAVILEKVKS